MRFIISGGGTGGHIFPAIAIANALKEIDKNVEILFVGAMGRMEMEKVPDAGYPIKGLRISGLQRKLTLKNLSFPFKVIMSIVKAKNIVREFQPHAAIGTGGYASGPLLYAASRMNIPCLIQEQNAFPGITNKLLAKRVNKVCVAYGGMEKYFSRDKIILSGNPVRQDILSLEGKRDEAMKFFGLDTQKKILLVVGGSLGARTINESIGSNLELLNKNNIQVIWQTGKNYFEIAKQQFKNEYGWLGPFISKMDWAYAAADAVVSRAGAISLSELALVKKPCILIPSPNVAEDHQTKNAMRLVHNDAALLVKDNEARQKLSTEIITLMLDKQKQIKLSENIYRMAYPAAAATIAEAAMKLAMKNK